MSEKRLILGTMKSSKSAQLIMNGYNLDTQGKKVLTFKPEVDTRDGEYVVSRALSSKRSARVVKKDNDGSYIYNNIKEHMPDVVLLDELQFFTVEQIDMLAKASVDFDIDIYAYGLMMSYNGRIFEPVRRAIECGFNIEMLKMTCDTCGKYATHHLLYLDGKLQVNGDSVNVEDFNVKEQVYKSVCFNCYLKNINYEKSKK